MNIQLKLIIATVVIIAILMVVNMVRKKKLDLRHALPWLAVGAAVLVLDFFPPIVNGLARMMGIDVPINMLFFLGFCFSLIILFGQTLAISHLADKVKRLTQEIALLEKEKGSSSAEG